MIAVWSPGSVLWAALVFFVWFMAIWVFIGLFADILRRHDLSGLGRASWVVLLVVLPLVGSLIYLAVRPPLTSGERGVVFGSSPPTGSSR